MLRWALLTFCMVISLSSRTKAVPSIAALNLVKEVVSCINKTWNLEDSSKPEVILQTMYQNSRKIEDVEHQILTTVEQSVGNLFKQFGSYPKLKHNLQDLADQVERISRRERLMRSYADSEGQLERHKLEAFASSTVAQGVNSVRELLTRMKRSVLGSPNLPSRRPGVLELVLEAMGKPDNAYNLGLSAQQILYQLYSAIVITDLRGYSLMQFSWMLLKVYGVLSLGFSA